MSGLNEDNRTFKDMVGIIADVLQKIFPGKKIRAAKIIVPNWLASIAGFTNEKYATLFNQPMLLSTDAIRAGTHPYYYTSQNASSDLGYKPKRTFRQGVEDMVDYYRKEQLMDVTERFIDKR
jgi:nucleoside-diphosphate-sugar epimerase